MAQARARRVGILTGGGDCPMSVPLRTAVGKGKLKRAPRVRVVARRLAGVLIATAALAGCHQTRQRPSAPTPSATPLPVKKAAEEVVVAAWAEPKRLPPGGGQSQILVRLRKRGGAPFEGVEVRLQASAGTLFSGGKVLLTDAAGQTRDRLTTHRTSEITLNAGGTVYRFRVPVGPAPES